LSKAGKLERAGKLGGSGIGEDPSWRGLHYIFLSKLEQILLFGKFWKAGTFI
jgi:hypothetical protein